MIIAYHFTLYKGFHSMMIHVKDASERCRKGSSPNMKDVRRKHFLPASKY